MHLSLLLTALLSQGASDHARFHAADVDLYLEVTDAAALAHSMRFAPLLDTFRDEPVRELIASFTGEQFDLDAMFDQVWESEIPEEARTMLQGLQSLSLSVRSGAEMPDYLMIAAFSDEALASAAFEHLKSEGPTQPLDDPAWPGAISADGPPGLDPWVGSRGAMLVSGSGAMRNAGLLSRLAGAGSGVESHALFTRSGTALGDTSVPTLVHGFFRRSPLSLAAELLMLTPDAPLDELGMLADLNLMGGAHRFRMGRKDDRYVTEIFSPDSTEVSPVAGAFGVAPIDSTRAAAIPTGMLGAYATTIDADRLGAIVRKGLALLAQQMGEPELLTSLESELGFPIERLFSHLGTQMTLQAQAIKGPSLPETAIWVDLKNTDAFAADLAVVAEKLPAIFEGFQARTRDYKVKNAEGERVPFPITSLTLPDGLIELDIPISIQPSVTIANGRLLMGFSSTHVKRELKRLLGAEAPDPALTNPWKQAGFDLPADARSVVFVDWGSQISGLVSLAKALGPLAGDALPIDFAAIPDGETFVQHFRPTVHYQVVKDDGIYRYHEASFGPETWLLPFAVLGSTDGVASAMAGSTDAEPIIVETAPVPEGDFATEFATEIALQQVRAAISIYQLDRSVPPATLDDLLTTSDQFPQGYLPSGQLPSDGWGSALVYKQGEEEGADYSLYSKGPNGIDEGGAGDDVNAQ